MTRSSAEQYLKACGFQVLGVDEPTRADSPDLPISTQNAATPLTNDDHAQATSRSAVQQEAREQPSVEKQRKKAPISTTPSDTPSPHSCAAAPQAQTGNTGAKVLRIHEAMARTGLGRTSFFNRINPAHSDFDPSFPKRVEIGRRARGFLERDIDAWIEKQTRK